MEYRILAPILYKIKMYVIVIQLQNKLNWIDGVR